MSGVLVAAVLVYWMTGSGQRQWWAVYVETTADGLVTAAPAASDSATATTDDKRNVDDQRPAIAATRLGSARDNFASYVRQQQQQQQQF